MSDEYFMSEANWQPSKVDTMETDFTQQIWLAGA